MKSYSYPSPPPNTHTKEEKASDTDRQSDIQSTITQRQCADALSEIWFLDLNIPSTAARMKRDENQQHQQGTDLSLQAANPGLQLSNAAAQL